MCERSVASYTPPTEHLAHNPGMRPDWELNWQPFGLQAGTQSTEPQISSFQLKRKEMGSILEINTTTWQE